ncbi:phage protein NinX family protein [Burkholderia sp. Tr-20390]|uniref:phage protein NinX family protein n=1 Tax=Burkholderia sp. Tr-20390 TaxID=2703904 RepID=UPI0019819DD9|nr:phage protein NinX family protein [Burkholderia sp. Tr-20390]MBN3729325.1 DUF2591 domain-containing protein [Burkholderia sp. Tr-20390]
MKVSELCGPKLDYWVACAEGLNHGHAAIEALKYTPSVAWAQGGPIVDRERISVVEVENRWWAGYKPATESMFGFGFDGPNQFGETYLVAAMRAFVASKYGEEIPKDSE